jgi:hypothetical protein
MTAADPGADLRLVYGTMRTRELYLLQQAFLLDRECGADRDFCNGRLRLIEAVLAERRDAADGAAADERR